MKVTKVTLPGGAAALEVERSPTEVSSPDTQTVHVPKQVGEGFAWDTVPLAPGAATIIVTLPDAAAAEKLGVFFGAVPGGAQKLSPVLTLKASPSLVASVASSSWFFADTVDATRKRDFARELRAAPIVDTASNAAGKTSANDSVVVTLALSGGRKQKALMKVPEGERGVLPGHRLGELFLNEVNASRLAVLLGKETLVSHAIDRHVDGRLVALQPWHDDTVRADATPPPGQRFERALAEELRVFDYLVGNPDRQGRNMLVVPTPFGNLPLGIDHGLAFPRGPIIGAHSYPHAWVEGQSGPLLASTRAFIDAMEPKDLAAALAQLGVPAAAAEHALRRLLHMKRDASFLAMDGDGMDAARAMSAKITKAGEDPSQGLDAATLVYVQALVADAYAPRAATLAGTGALLHEAETGKVFLVKDGRRWHIPNPDVFAAMKLDWKQVKATDPKVLDLIPEVASI